jgi:hypothetical protein
LGWSPKKKSERSGKKCFSQVLLRTGRPSALECLLEPRLNRAAHPVQTARPVWWGKVSSGSVQPENWSHLFHSDRDNEFERQVGRATLSNALCRSFVEGFFVNRAKSPEKVTVLTDAFIENARVGGSIPSQATTSSSHPSSPNPHTHH